MVKKARENASNSQNVNLLYTHIYDHCPSYHLDSLGFLFFTEEKLCFLEQLL